MRTFKSWSCSQSGDCCRTQPYITMSDAEAKLLMARANRRVLAFRPDPKPGFMQMLAGPCPFLEGEHDCAVYDVRPYNCRRFTCMRGFKGTEREALAVRVQIQRRAQPWANAHGWSA